MVSSVNKILLVCKPCNWKSIFNNLYLNLQKNNRVNKVSHNSWFFVVFQAIEENANKMYLALFKLNTVYFCLGFFKRVSLQYYLTDFLTEFCICWSNYLLNIFPGRQTTPFQMGGLMLFNSLLRRNGGEVYSNEFSVNRQTQKVCLLPVSIEPELEQPRRVNRRREIFE